MKTLRLEATAPFQGLAELVAYDEGLFEKEGIQIEWLDRELGRGSASRRGWPIALDGRPEVSWWRGRCRR